MANGGAHPGGSGGPSAAQTALTRPVFFGLLGFCFLLRLLALLRPIEALDGVTIPDDCYYTLHLARSIARGLGPFYGLGHTNGFQPLFGFLMVPAFWIFNDPLSPVRAALLLSAVADTLALAFLARLLDRQVRHGRVVAVVMILWAVSPYTISNATNGLETSLSVCLLLAAIGYFPRLSEPLADRRRFFIFGVLGGLALFARVDTGIALGLAAALMVRPLLARGVGVAIRSGAATAAGVVLVNLPWWLYSYRYTGRIYPVSGRAVRHISQADVHHHPTLTNFYIPEIREGVRVLLVNHWPTLVLLAVLALLIALRQGRPGFARLGRAIWQQKLLVLFGAALFAAYTLYIFTEWFFARYFYPLNAALLVITGLALHQVLGSVDDRRSRRGALVAAVAFMVVSAARGDFRAIYRSNDPQHLASMNIGLWARQHYPAGTIVGCPQSGGLGYFADTLTVVNLDGVVNQDAFQAMLQRRLIDYVREVKVQDLLIWSNTIDLIREESADMRPTDVTLLMDIKEFQTYRKPWHIYRVNER